MLKLDLIRQVSKYEKDAGKAGDKTAVERRLTKREPISHSKTSLNRNSAHCITVEAQTKMSRGLAKKAERNNVLP